MESITLDVGLALGAVVTVIVAVVGTGVALASQSRADRAEAAADRRAFQTEMQRLAERQSHIEGRLDERRAAAD